MITINTLQISVDRLSMSVSLTAEVGDLFTSVNLWTESTFKDYTQAIDFSSKLAGSTNTESFTILASDLNIPVFDGLYFLEFGDNAANLQLGSVAELTTYKKCLLDSTLEILGSNVNVLKGEGCNNTDFNKVIYVNAILNALQAAMISGYYGEAIDLIAVLKKFCTECPDCPTLSSILSLGTLNNNLIII